MSALVREREGERERVESREEIGVYVSEWMQGVDCVMAGGINMLTLQLHFYQLILHSPRSLSV